MVHHGWEKYGQVKVSLGFSRGAPYLPNHVLPARMSEGGSPSHFLASLRLVELFLKSVPGLHFCDCGLEFIMAAIKACPN